MVRQLSTQQNEPAISVRDAAPNDVSRLVELINALNVHEGAAQSMTTQHAEFMLFAKARPVDLRCVVSVRAKKVIGFVLFYQGYDTASTSFGYHIADIFVEESMRKQGVGDALMQEVAARCLNGGGQWCSLTTSVSNHSAKNFYDTIGCFVQPVEFRAMGTRALLYLVK